MQWLEKVEISTNGKTVDFPRENKEDYDAWVDRSLAYMGNKGWELVGVETYNHVFDKQGHKYANWDVRHYLMKRIKEE